MSWVHPMNQELREVFAGVRLLVLDFDGVLTDGAVYVDSDGHESVRCSHRDGQGIQDIRAAGIDVIVISGQRSSYVAARCKKMGIVSFNNVGDKVACLKDYMNAPDRTLTLKQVCFVGDDRGDMPLLHIAGVPCTVADAITECKKVARYITSASGGNGAVREICDLILEAKEAL